MFAEKALLLRLGQATKTKKALCEKYVRVGHQ